MSQSLAVEETLSGPDSPATGTRLLELALIAAGQKQWEEGVGYLERILSLTTKLNDKDQATLANILRFYAGKLENMQQAEQAARFRDAHAALQESLQSQEKTASP